MGTAQMSINSRTDNEVVPPSTEYYRAMKTKNSCLHATQVVLIERSKLWKGTGYCSKSAELDYIVLGCKHR